MAPSWCCAYRSVSGISRCLSERHRYGVDAEDACRACGHRSHEPRECSDDRRVASGKRCGCEAWTDGPVGGSFLHHEGHLCRELNRLFRPAPLMKTFSLIAIKRTTYCKDAILVPGDQTTPVLQRSTWCLAKVSGRASALAKVRRERCVGARHQSHRRTGGIGGGLHISCVVHARDRDHSVPTLYKLL